MDYQVICIRCESDNVLTFFIQIRETDERLNEYHRCLTCQYGWKQSLESPQE